MDFATKVMSSLPTKFMSSLPNAWITTGPLASGNFCQVIESTGKTYTVHRQGNIYLCDCPSYRFGSKNKNKIPSQWTCKHLRSIEGNENEDIRTSHQHTVAPLVLTSPLIFTSLSSLLSTSPSRSTAAADAAAAVPTSVSVVSSSLFCRSKACAKHRPKRKKRPKQNRRNCRFEGCTTPEQGGCGGMCYKHRKNKK